MLFQLMTLATILQDLFTVGAEFLGRATGFIQVENKLTGPAVAQALVFRWLANPKDTLENMAAALGVTAQALQQHCPQAVPFFQALIQMALQKLHACRAKARSLGLLESFPAVIIDDTTTVSLPAELAKLFPGCGGNSPAAGTAVAKLLFRYELKSGRILTLSFHPGRDNDAPLAANAADLPEKALYLADMGFFNADRLRDFDPAKRFWITRVPATTCVKVSGLWQSLWQWLSGAVGGVLDVATAGLVKSVGTSCRLVALRCPEEVANRRRQKLREATWRKKKREPSAESLALCAWTVLATNVEVKVLAARSVWTAYRCRWQIELFFKRAKQLCGWEYSRGHEGQRVLVELLAKILGLLVLHWAALLHGGPLSGVSDWKVMVKVVEFARQLQASLSKGIERIGEVLQEMLKELQTIRPQRPRKKKPSTRDLLLNPGLAA